MGTVRKLLAVATGALVLTMLMPLAGIAGAVEAQLIMGPDGYESDDTTTTATFYNPATMGNTWTSLHTFHDLGANDGSSDESDYVEVTIEETGTPIFIETQRVGVGFYDTMLYVRDAEGTQLAYNDDSYVWEDTYSSNIYYVAPAPGTYYIEANNLDDRSYAYLLHVTIGDARRVAGSDRYATANAVNSLIYDNTNNPTHGTGYGPNKIYIASGIVPWDALSAGAASAASIGDDSALFLTRPDYLPDSVFEEIVRVTESQYWYDYEVEIFVCGGPEAISNTVFDKLKTVPGVSNVERLAGGNRYETAAEISARADDIEGLGSVLFIVSGEAWADAVAAAPVAGYGKSALLMTMKNDVPTVTMDYISARGITDVVVVGGSAVVAEPALNELRSAVGTANVEVVAGADRYETARRVADYGVDNFAMNATTCQLVSGEDYVDALASAPMAAFTAAPTLLTERTSLHPQVKDYFNDAGAIGHNYSLGTNHAGWGCWLIGGEAAVSEATYNAFRDYWKMIP